jgi:hypothetical protein
MPVRLPFQLEGWSFDWLKLGEQVYPHKFDTDARHNMPTPYDNYASVWQSVEKGV